MFGEALLNLADIANCVSNDFHLMHLNFKGDEFDQMHKKVLKKYYEQAANDYDSWSEAASMFDITVETPNSSVVRIDWQSFNSEVVTKTAAVERTTSILEEYMNACVIVFKALNKEADCFKAIGIASDLQNRIAYWGKELAYFNKRRVG